VTELRQIADKYVNLALPENGAAICSVSDDFFAPAKRMLSAKEPVFIEGRFDAHGKWMDGWESRRKRVAGHDQCIVRICHGVVHAIEVDTRHFTGNFPPAVIRLHIYPDGGIARLRIYGEPDHTSDAIQKTPPMDLLSADVGGQALECNNMHFGHMRNLISTTPVANMGDGWETRRRRKAGNDWVILKLGRQGKISRVEVDTAFFRGNYPARCSLKVATLGPDDDTSDSTNWAEVLPEVALGPDQLHIFVNQLIAINDITHVRLDIYPDGGVARLRILGEPSNLQGHD
jgi:allantoicase